MNTNTGKKEDHAIRYSSLKEICGFLNTGDGTLIIGVTDRMEILGIERDGLNKNKDKYSRLIMDLIRASMGDVAAGNVFIKFEELEDKVVCIIECKKGASPTYLTFKNNKEDFFYRVGSSTVSPPPSELYRILNERF